MTNTNNSRSLLAIACLSAIVSTQSYASDDATAYINGKIYTGEVSVPIVDSVIIEDGLFTYVGNAPEVDSNSVRIVDLKGQVVVPGLYDSHIHPIGAGEKLLFECSFPQSATLDEIFSAVEHCSKTIPEGSWIIGGSWSADKMDSASAENLKKLDLASKGRPVVLTDFSHHNSWANSAAMKEAGIDKDYAKEYQDLVILDDNGELTGFFVEQSQDALRNAMPTRTVKDYAKAAKRAVSELNKYGIIGVKDSYVFDNEYKAWKQLDDSGELTAHVALSWGWPSGKTTEDKAEKFKAMVKPSSGHLDTMYAKISLDGIPPTHTAAMLEPYSDSEKEALGKLKYSEKVLAKDLLWLDRNGYTTQIHAVGDRAARTVLNAVESIRKIEGNKTLRHEIAHACIVESTDLGRFSDLGVIPNFSPVFWYPSPIQDGLEKVIGKERGTRNCAMKSLTENGSRPTGGSDWPVSESVNPWKAMEAMVTRKDPNGLRENETLWPEERVTMKDALTMYTINGALAQRAEAHRGSIKVGKSADMVIINQDIFNVEPSAIGETEVVETIFEGYSIYKIN